MKRKIVVICAVLSLLMVTTQSNGRMKITPGGVTFPDATTQTSASASTQNVVCMPTWHQILPVADRFQLVMNDEAVLDKETGLVWEKSPDTTWRTWAPACDYCYMKQVGGRLGWRLPTIEELASLVDTSQAFPQSFRALPTGHPFTNVGDGDAASYWSSSTYTNITSNAWYVDFVHGLVKFYSKSDSNTSSYVWCVRGGHGHDAY